MMAADQDEQSEALASERDVPASGRGASAKSPTGKRSELAYPYDDLESAEEIARIVHDRFGGECDPDQLAAALGHANPRSGAFTSKLGAARRFGLIGPKRGAIEITALGLRILSDETRRAARIEAFLEVPLFSALFEAYRSSVLPENAGLEARMRSLGVPTKGVTNARQVFQRSAKQAGFFEVNPDRLVKPASMSTSNSTQAATPLDEQQKNQDTSPAGSHNEEMVGHPLLVGLWKMLPPETQKFPKSRRETWLQAAALNLDLVYGSEDHADPPRSKPSQPDS
jgi:hypothetical protein